jgi:hypothetical protein
MALADHVQPGRVVTDAAQLEELSNQLDRFVVALADLARQRSFEVVDLRRHEFHLLPLPSEADPQRLGHRLPIPLRQSFEPGPKPRVHLGSTPTVASNPAIRFVTRVRSCFNVNNS